MAHPTAVLRLAAILTAAAFATAAAAESPETFLKEAIQGNLAEVSMGELAQKNGGSDAVKNFGRMLAADHGKARDESTALAKKMKIEVPRMPTAEAQAMHQKMSKMQGAEFDRYFASHMAMDHEEEIKKYQEVAKANPDNDVGKYASSSIPVLEKHLKTAQSIPKK